MPQISPILLNIVYLFFFADKWLKLKLLVDIIMYMLYVTQKKMHRLAFNSIL